MSMEEGHELRKCYAHNLRQLRQHKFLLTKGAISTQKQNIWHTR